ncbi:MAG TPA: FG-GAP-like repeat-containing protein, partial [Planctomycetota bacterium]|nr:FG-GAP-like repeat-containing protein [Planctomycetota bacterium]
MSIDRDGFGRSPTSASGAMRHRAASGSSIHLFAALLLLSVSARAQDAPNPPIELADIANGEGGFQLAADGLPSVGRCSIIEPAGDVNGDGVVDIVVVEPGSRDHDRILVVFGDGQGGFPPLADVERGVGGFSIHGGKYPLVAGRGDINGDGRSDLLLGCFDSRSSSVPSFGKAYVIFGKDDSSAVRLEDIERGEGGYVILPFDGNA